jgi:hypothetical protein
MYCPNCGTQASPEQKFCRSCGLSLQTISQVLAGQSPAAEPDRSLVAIIEEFQSQRNKILRRGFLTMWGGIVVAALFGTVGGAISTFNPGLGNALAALAGIGGVILLVGVGLMAYSRFLPKAEACCPPAQLTTLPQGESPIQLPPERHPVSMPSITEHTTVKLHTPEYEPPRTAAEQVRK